MKIVHTDNEPGAPKYTCYTIDQARNEALSALAVCVLSTAERVDCEQTLAICAAHKVSA